MALGIPLYYKGELISEHRPDLIVGDEIVVEIKSIARFEPIHMAIMLTYLRVASLQLGLQTCDALRRKTLRASVARHHGESVKVTPNHTD